MDGNKYALRKVQKVFPQNALILSQIFITLTLTDTNSAKKDTGAVHALEWVDFLGVQPHPTGSTLILLSARTTQIFATVKVKPK